VPLIIFPCATLAVLPPQELTTQKTVSKVLLYSGLNGSMRAWAGQRSYSEGPPLKILRHSKSQKSKSLQGKTFTAQRGWRQGT